MRFSVFIFMLVLGACQSSPVDLSSQIDVLKSYLPDVDPNNGAMAALAVVPGEGRTHHGFMQRSGHSESVMTQRALAACGSERCQIVQRWRRGECVGLAQGDQQIFWNKGQDQTLDGALNQVMSACLAADQACVLLRNVCL